MVDELALVLAVIYASILCSSNSRDLNSTAEHILAVHEHLSILMNFPNDTSATTVKLLQAHVIVTTVQTSKRELLSAHEQLPQLVRAAQSLGLHSLEDASQDLDAEMTRWLWWHLVYLDVEAALMTGLPTFIHPNSFTTKAPTQESMDPLSGVSELGANMLVSSSAMKLASIARLQWASRMQVWLQGSPNLAEMESFRTEMNDIVVSIPITDATTWPRVYCSLIADRAVCVLSQDLRKRNGVVSLGCEQASVRYFCSRFCMK